MIRRPPRSTLSSSSAASDVYKRQGAYSSSAVVRGPIGGQTSVSRRGLSPTVRNVDLAAGAEPLLDQQTETLKGDFGVVRREPPVSYTHLRAHETPEHLVCRL